MKFRKDYNHDSENIFDACGFDETEFIEFNLNALNGIIQGTTSLSQLIEELDSIIGESDLYRRWAAMAIIFLGCASVLRSEGVIGKNETVH